MKGIITNELDYEAALAEIEELVDRDPERGTREGDRLELLGLLVEDYESKQLQVAAPTPVEAILFRMEQEGLTRRDLAPYLGGRSKVSEVLSGKRPLSLSMIRALHAGLGIPARLLIQEDSSSLQAERIEWERFPIRTMTSWGWFDDVEVPSSVTAEGMMRRFLAPLGSRPGIAALQLRTSHVRSARAMDEYALAAWSSRVAIRALADLPRRRFSHGHLGLDFMRALARLSPAEDGPLLARDLLAENGISLIIERHLPRTYLDGAALMTQRGVPVIGLSLRYDRLDNFWFCLMHELAHIVLHLGVERFAQYFDDLDVGSPHDRREREADSLAGEALVPQSEWQKSPARHVPSPEAAASLAMKLNVHPAIVAGRIRHEENDYRLLNALVGHHGVRKHFPDVHWR
jgi:HTH-type transcriptional regulator/antitoxin HigA